MKRRLRLSKPATEATNLLGASIRAARLRRNMTIREVAERVGVSMPTMRRVEAGDPTVAIGTMFETATVVGVALYDPDPDIRSALERAISTDLALLPSRALTPHIDDDF